MAGATSIIVYATELSYEAAENLCEQILGRTLSSTVILDLKFAEDITTAAFARLVILRRELLKEGRDLVLRGLRLRAAGLWRINRLAGVLPQI